MSANVTQRKTTSPVKATSTAVKPAGSRPAFKRNWFWILFMWYGVFGMIYTTYRMLPVALAWKGAAAPFSAPAFAAAMKPLGRIGECILRVLGHIPKQSPVDVLVGLLLQVSTIPIMLIFLSGPATPCKVRLYKAIVFFGVIVNAAHVAYSFRQDNARGYYALACCAIYVFKFKFYRAYVHGVCASSWLPYYRV